MTLKHHSQTSILSRRGFPQSIIVIRPLGAAPFNSLGPMPGRAMKRRAGVGSGGR